MDRQRCAAKQRDPGRLDVDSGDEPADEGEAANAADGRHRDVFVHEERIRWDFQRENRPSADVIESEPPASAVISPGHREVLVRLDRDLIAAPKGGRVADGSKRALRVL